MEVTLREVTVRELTEGFVDNHEDGVLGYGGRLDIRPPYQREFVYKDAQRDAVIQTAMSGFPLNVMYWAVREDGGFEIIDGQQRTLSLCQYVEGEFAYAHRYFHNLLADERESLMEYKLMVYLCSGTPKEKLDWFRTINIAGVKLTDQELRNAVYAGTWVTDAKRYFSKNGCPAIGLGGAYLDRSAIRQEYLETVIDWISAGQIDDYMARNQHTTDAGELWGYFERVISWVKAVFPDYRREMKGVAWGALYNRFHAEQWNPASLADEVSRLMEDESVTNHSGVYAYVLSREEKHLNIRRFDQKQKRLAYERQGGKCAICQGDFEIEEMEADHIVPWHAGGKTEVTNCQMLCRDDNRRKGGR